MEYRTKKRGKRYKGEVDINQFNNKIKNLLDSESNSQDMPYNSTPLNDCKIGFR